MHIKLFHRILQFIFNNLFIMFVIMCFMYKFIKHNLYFLYFRCTFYIKSKHVHIKLYHWIFQCIFNYLFTMCSFMCIM